MGIRDYIKRFFSGKVGPSLIAQQIRVQRYITIAATSAKRTFENQNGRLPRPGDFEATKHAALAWKAVVDMARANNRAFPDECKTLFYELFFSTGLENMPTQKDPEHKQ